MPTTSRSTWSEPKDSIRNSVMATVQAVEALTLTGSSRVRAEPGTQVSLAVLHREHRQHGLDLFLADVRQPAPNVPTPTVSLTELRVRARPMPTARPAGSNSSRYRRLCSWLPAKGRRAHRPGPAAQTSLTALAVRGAERSHHRARRRHASATATVHRACRASQVGRGPRHC